MTSSARVAKRARFAVVVFRDKVFIGIPPLSIAGLT
jgi:hypothetical protein